MLADQAGMYCNARPSEALCTIARVQGRRRGIHPPLAVDTRLSKSVLDGLFAGVDMPSVGLVESEVEVALVRQPTVQQGFAACAAARHNGRGESALAAVVTLAATCQVPQHRRRPRARRHHTRVILSYVHLYASRKF